MHYFTNHKLEYEGSAPMAISFVPSIGIDSAPDRYDLGVWSSHVPAYSLYTTLDWQPLKRVSLSEKKHEFTSASVVVSQGTDLTKPGNL
jgi:hypothetical protein